MNINRHNYEEFFILYMDNELGSEDRRMVEAFVTLHPDLKEELDILLQTKLLPDQHIVFDDKEELLLFNPSSFDVSLSNYEEWLVMYTDNELNEEQRAAVENFVLHNPIVQEELQLLQKTKLVPETVIFPNKKSLYRTEKVRRIPAWWKMAAAAAIVTGIGTAAIVIINNRQPAVTIDPIANTTGTEKKSQIINPVAAEQKVQPINSQPTTADNNDKNALVTADITKQAKRVVSTEEKSTPLAANNSSRNTNNLTTPDHNPNVNPLNSDVVASNPKRVNKEITAPAETISPIPVTNKLPQSYIDRPDVPITAVYNPSDEPGDDEPAGKKNKLRGFFRKVTRTFEKRTSIDATDGEDRLLVAGLSIKLK